jgi:hypothetical protein
MLSITSRHSLPPAAANNASSPFVSVPRAVDVNTAQKRAALRKPSLNVAHLRCDSFCSECEHWADSRPTAPLSDFRLLRDSFAAIRDVFASAPALPSGDELRNCLTAGVQVLDAFLALVGDPPSRRAVVAADMMGKVRRRMASARRMASDWLCEALRDIVLEFADDDADLHDLLAAGTLAARAFDYGYAQLFHSEKKLLLRHKQQQRPCDAIFIHTYLAPCAGCLAFMEAFATANTAAIVVSHSIPHENDVARRNQCPQRVQTPSVCWLD